MTDRTDHRTDHRAAAERMLADADEWTAQAGELSPEASELSCLAYAAVHALLAIHDTLAAADRYAANEERQREGAEPDPLDEDDHRDRVDGIGDRLTRHGVRHWHHWDVRCSCVDPSPLPLTYFESVCGPLTFAPDATGAPSVTAPVADDPADDAVDGEEDERRYLNAQDAELSRLLAVSTDPTAALRRAATMEAVGVTDEQAKWFAQILAKGRVLPDDLQRLKAAVEQTGDGRG